MESLRQTVHNKTNLTHGIWAQQPLPLALLSLRKCDKNQIFLLCTCVTLTAFASSAIQHVSITPLVILKLKE